MGRVVPLKSPCANFVSHVFPCRGLAIVLTYCTRVPSDRRLQQRKVQNVFQASFKNQKEAALWFLEEMVNSYNSCTCMHRTKEHALTKQLERSLLLLLRRARDVCVVCVCVCFILVSRAASRRRHWQHERPRLSVPLFRSVPRYAEAATAAPLKQDARGSVSHARDPATYALHVPVPAPSPFHGVE